MRLAEYDLYAEIGGRPEMIRLPLDALPCEGYSGVNYIVRFDASVFDLNAYE